MPAMRVVADGGERVPGLPRPLGFRQKDCGLVTGPQKLSLGQVAERFGVDRRTVNNWVRAGKLPAVKTLGGHWRVRTVDVDKIQKEAK